ncbi:LysR substrate binding domain-containing protein [Burkholderia sp. D7]|nr:LysR substrate binding domain-containing protein [Burkholderia sp. D7]
MQGALAVNDAEAYVMCGVKGAGIVQAPQFMLVPHLRSGELVEVLPQWKPRPMPIAAVYPHNRHLAPKVRVFVDWIALVFEKCPLMSSNRDVQGRCLIDETGYQADVHNAARALGASAQAYA